MMYNILEPEKWGIMKKQVKYYGHRDKESGIYRIQNIKTGRFYIGSTINFYNRHHSHMTQLLLNTHQNPLMQKDANEYGRDLFVFGVVEYCNKDELKYKEQYYMSLWNPTYNKWCSPDRPVGFKHSKETCEKIGKIHKGKKRSEECKAKMRAAWERRKKREDYQTYCESIVRRRSGVKASEETRKKLSEIHRGQKHSEEFCEKTRKRRLGTKLINGHYVKV